MFDKVTKDHIIQGIKDFEEEGYPKGFGPSSTYDLVFEGKKYPQRLLWHTPIFMQLEEK